jgi:hypothetical protein
MIYMTVGLVAVRRRHPVLPSAVGARADAERKDAYAVHARSPALVADRGRAVLMVAPGE